MAAGIAFGLLGTMAARQLIASLEVMKAASDLPIIAGLVAGVVAAGIVAALVAARQAASV